MHYDNLMEYEFEQAIRALEEDDRFDDYAEDEEPKNHEPEDFDLWDDPVSKDEFMHMVL